MSTLELRGELLRAGDLLEMDLFIIDHTHGEYLLDGVQGLAELLYADGSVCAAIAFDEYFGLDTGAFKISFWNVPNYPLKGLQVTLGAPSAERHFVSLDESLAAQVHTPESYLNSFAKPLDI